MKLFDDIAGFLKEPVGNNLINNPDDVRGVKDRLRRIGYFDDDEENENGFITKELDSAVKTFQHDNGLKVDGYLLPRGETENTITEQLGKRVRTPGIVPEQPKQAKPDSPFVLSLQDDEPEPVRFDATGRMIKPWKNPQQQQQETKKTPPKPERKPHDSPYRPPILKDVDDETVKREVVEHEGVASHLYKDTAKDGGRVTIGPGVMLPDAEAAKKLPFTVPDGKGGRRQASPEEIERAFKKVETVKNDNYRAQVFKPGEGKKARQYDLDDLRLPKDVSNRLLDEKLREHAAIVRRKFENFESFPPQAQKVLLDLQYNSGLKLSDWKNLNDAVKTRDWAKAAREVNRKDVGFKRNRWAKEQMEKAQQWQNRKQ